MSRSVRRVIWGVLLGIPSLIVLAGLIITIKFGWNFVQQTALLGFQAVHPYRPANTKERVFKGNHNIWPTLPQPGTKIGTISIPAINLSVPIVQGTSWHDLSLGVGHYEGSMLPGQKGNVILSGHRDTVFTPLQHIKLGDLVVVHTPYGPFSYKVVRTTIVPKADTHIVVPSTHSQLTLTTCYPFVYIGFAPKRFIVWAIPVGSHNGNHTVKPNANLTTN